MPKPVSATRLVPGSLLALGCVALAACAPEFDASQSKSARASLGQEVYGVLCDRIGAAELREDLTGVSFRGVCHDDGAGFADRVDEALLPPLVSGATDRQGQPVSLEEQQRVRERGIARLHTFVKHRDAFILALDTTIPDVAMQIHDTQEPGGVCSAPASKVEGSLQTELAGLLARFGDLYMDGTVPASTRALGATVETFRDSPEARKAWSNLAARQGYRPPGVALGLVRPLAAYPRLRELSNVMLRLVSSDSTAYSPVDALTIAPQPGVAYPEFNKLLEVARSELHNAVQDPSPGGLLTTDVPEAGLTRLSRPRGNLELFESVMLAEHPDFGGGPERYIVRRDLRGLADVAVIGGSSPFLDTDGDGLADVDESGRFMVREGSAPTPFLLAGTPSDNPRDSFGRALLQQQLAYRYVDTSRTFTASTLDNMRPLFNADPSAQHETIMDALAGVYVIAGQRTNAPASKTYADGSTIQYNAVKHDTSPLLDAVHAFAQLLAEPAVDDTMLLFRKLLVENEGDLARLLGAVLEGRDLAAQHPEAKIPASSTLWDDLIDIMARISQEPGLLEDLLAAMADDDTLLLGNVLSSWTTHRDELSYNRNDLNGPVRNATTGSMDDPKTPVDRSQPDSGDNRSMLQRFLQLMHDGNGVASCNRPNAKVRARYGIDITLPDIMNGAPYKECGIFMVPDLDKFLLQSMVGSPKATLNIRDKFMRNGFMSYGRATVKLMEDSSGMTGFFTPADSTVLRPTSAWLSRLVFFNLEENTPGLNDRTRNFLRDLNGEWAGSAVCPERIIDDPCANGGCDFGGDVPATNDVAPDGKIRGLRSCQDGDWLQQRNRNTLFMLERLDAARAFGPIARAFVNRDREDLFIDLSVKLHEHWQSAEGTANECKLAGGRECYRDGASSYEAYMGKLLQGDLLPSLARIVKTVQSTSITRCTTLADDGSCAASEQVNGLQLLADATRVLVDPRHAATVDLRDRLGGTNARRNDGTIIERTTPVHLLTSALSSFDRAYDDWNAAHPDDADRQTQFRRARSQLTDQFLRVSGSGDDARFANRAVVSILPTVIDLMRSQAWANCPRSFTAPYARCEWARTKLTKNIQDVVIGPLFASSLDLADKMRADADARRELQLLVSYLLDAASKNDALPAMLASANDLVQILRDDANLVPFYKVLATALEPNQIDAETGEIRKGLVDAALFLLGKVAGRYVDLDGQEICAREIDPNQVLNILLDTVVTPRDELGGQAPVEVLLDVIADVNQLAPEAPKPNYDVDDYESIAKNTAEFLLGEERGLEQFYEIVRKGIRQK